MTGDILKMTNDRLLDLSAWNLAIVHEISLRT